MHHHEVPYPTRGTKVLRNGTKHVKSKPFGLLAKKKRDMCSRRLEGGVRHHDLDGQLQVRKARHSIKGPGQARPKVCARTLMAP
jgi:hypothetical protein